MYALLVLEAFERTPSTKKSSFDNRLSRSNNHEQQRERSMREKTGGTRRRTGYFFVLLQHDAEGEIPISLQ